MCEVYIYPGDILCWIQSKKNTSVKNRKIKTGRKLPGGIVSALNSTKIKAQDFGGFFERF